MHIRQYVLTLCALATGCATSPAPATRAPTASSESRRPAETPVRPLDAVAIGEAAGAQPTTTSDGAVRVAWARDDVPVTVDGRRFPPAAGLGSWAAFTATAGGAMMMGDTVVFEDEVSPAMDAAFASGLEVTGLHNHFFFDRPKVYFMHIGGMGDSAALARAVRAVWDAIREVRRRRARPAEDFGGASIERGAVAVAPLQALLGVEPTVSGGVVKFTYPREGTMHGARVGGGMGLTTWIAFSGTDAHAAIDGDFIMEAHEVQAVLRALRAQQIHVVALHNHMIGEAPPFYFTHFWATGAAHDLAQGFKAALHAQASVSRE